VNAAIDGLIARSTASGWLLCIIGVAGLIQLARIVATQRPKMRELDISEGESLRDALVGQMTALRDDIKDLRGENHGLRTEVKGLRDENQGLRNEVRALHGIIDGMRRENMQAGISTQRAVVESLPRDFVPDKTREALERIQGTGE